MTSQKEISDLWLLGSRCKFARLPELHGKGGISVLLDVASMSQTGLGGVKTTHTVDGTAHEHTQRVK